MTYRLLVSLTLLLGAVASTAQSVPRSNHVVVVVLENRNYVEVIGNTGQMPWLNSIAQKGSIATNYYANEHGSIADYFMLTTGQLVTTDDTYTRTVTVDNLARELIAQGRTWKEYAESRPAVGWTGGDYDGVYVEHHSPFSFFSDVRNSSAQKQNLVRLADWTNDVSKRTLPAFSFVVPNNEHNSHDGTLPEADQWLQTNIGPLLQTPYFQAGGDGILFFVFDESDAADSANGGGHVATILYGPGVKVAYQGGTFYQHQSLLNTVGKALGLNTIPGSGASAPTMTEFFGATPPPPGCQ
jgi:phosphatidylinositol-3-phosphatase